MPSFPNVLLIRAAELITEGYQIKVIFQKLLQSRLFRPPLASGAASDSQNLVSRYLLLDSRISDGKSWGFVVF